MNERDLMRLTIETGVSLSTVRKWAKGGKVNAAYDTLLSEAIRAIRERKQLENQS